MTVPCVPKASSALIGWRIAKRRCTMVALLQISSVLVGSLLKPKLRLEAERAALRHQLIIFAP